MHSPDNIIYNIHQLTITVSYILSGSVPLMSLLLSRRVEWCFIVTSSSSPNWIYFFQNLLLPIRQQINQSSLTPPNCQIIRRATYQGHPISPTVWKSLPSSSIHWHISEPYNMARTKDMSDAAPPFMPTAGGGMIMKFCDEQEVRIENRKIKVLVWLTGEESDTERATSFYMCAGKLDTEASHISAAARITHLVDHANAGMILTYVCLE